MHARAEAGAAAAAPCLSETRSRPRPLPYTRKRIHRLALLSAGNAETPLEKGPSCGLDCVREASVCVLVYLFIHRGTSLSNHCSSLAENNY